MSTQTPPLAPKLTDNVTVHIVLNDFGKLGRAFLETDEQEADEWTTVTNIINGEYSNPVRAQVRPQWKVRCGSSENICAVKCDVAH
jgi:hypothetical protein